MGHIADPCTSLGSKHRMLNPQHRGLVDVERDLGLARAAGEAGVPRRYRVRCSNPSKNEINLRL
jgi:hypothetical protein